MKKLNQAYFIIFLVIITIMQFMIYDRTLQMDKLQKGTRYIQLMSEEMSQLEEDQGVAFQKLKKDSQGIFTALYLVSEEGNARYPFLQTRKVSRSFGDKTDLLDRDNMHHKQIYDACDTPGVILQEGDRFYIARKNGNNYQVFQTKQLSLPLTGLAPVWYMLLALILIVMVLFVVTPEQKFGKYMLSATLVGQNFLLYVLAYLGITSDHLSNDTSLNIVKNLGDISSVTAYNFRIMFIVVFGATLLFLMFYNSKWCDRFSHTITKHKSPYLYILPGGSAIVFLSLIPLISGLLLSFFRVQYNEYHFIWFDNYIDIIWGGLKDITNPKGFYYTLFVTIIWTVTNIFLHISIGIALALMINRKKLRFKKIYSLIFILPWAIPNYITALIWKSMFNKQFGAINNFLDWIGVGGISWFTTTLPAFMANLMTNVWMGFPFMMVMTLGALQSIPLHLYDAATMDGASRWQQFKYITLPMLKPALLPSIILGFIWTFNMFNVIYLVSGGAPQSSTEILITEAYRWAFERNGRYGYAAAYATIIFLVLVVYNQMTNRIQRKSEGA